jgi:hypothetical protein
MSDRQLKARLLTVLSAKVDGLKVKYRKTSIPYRFHIASVAAILCGLILSRFLGKSAFSAAGGLSSALIVSGFFMWCVPAIQTWIVVWERPFAKLPLILMHLFALLIATALARSMVAQALGLPPQSFDLTVAFLALLFYVPAAMAIAAVILTVAGGLLFLIFAMLFLVGGSAQLLSPVLVWLGVKKLPRGDSFIIYFHSAAALMAGYFLMAGYDFFTGPYNARVLEAIRYLSVKSDFHSSPNYPGVEADEWVHPLENGYIAYARMEKGENMHISVRFQKVDGKFDRPLALPSAQSTAMTLPWVKVDNASK